ncbi:MAG TPA: hypothetical protein VJM07_00630 [Gaiella sp.]|nr:hypothetical protein [Gaiella sp.]
MLQDDAPGENPAHASARVAGRHSHDDQASLAALRHDRLADDGLLGRDHTLEVGAIGETAAYGSVRVAGCALPTPQVDPADTGGEAGARARAKVCEVAAHLVGVLRDDCWRGCDRRERLQLAGEVRVEHGRGENRARSEILRRVILAIVVLTPDERQGSHDDDEHGQQRSQKERPARPRHLSGKGILEGCPGPPNPTHIYELLAEESSRAARIASSIVDSTRIVSASLTISKTRATCFDAPATTIADVALMA